MFDWREFPKSSRPKLMIHSSLTTRHRVAELMDDPTLGQGAHRQALAGLGRINRISRSARVLLRFITRASPWPTDRPMQLLDVACGGGDVAIELGKLAKRRGLKLEITVSDISDQALRYAADRARDAKVDIHFSKFDAIGGPWAGRFDVVTSTLFLHHLPRAEAVALMRQMSEHATMVLIDDLRRTHLGFVLAWLGTRLVSRSRIVHVDGPRSVRGAFTVDEMQLMAIDAGLTPAAIYRHWPQRMLLYWDARHG